MADDNNGLVIGEIAEMVTQMLTDDSARDDIFGKIDDAVDCVFNPSQAVAELPWVKGRHYAMPDISDARNAGTRTFSTLLPQIEIAPNTELDAEYERTEMAEQALSWEFERMNRVEAGKKGIHDLIVESAVTYHAVAFQTQYLPYHLKGRRSEPRIKALLRQKNFNWPIHHPGTVHSRYSDFGLECVAKVSSYSVQSLIDNFGENNPGVAKLMENFRGATKAMLLNTFYTLVDYMDWTDRAQFAIPGKNIRTIGKSNIVFMNEKHGLPFIPWVIVDYGNPLWRAVIKSGLWENLQHVNLIRFAKAVELSARSNLVIRTPDGTLKQVWIDFSNPSSPIVIPADGTEVSNIQPNPIDPGLESMFQDMKATNSKSTVAQILQDPTPFLASPFATLQASLTTALGQLSPAKKTAEAAEAAGLTQCFEWIEHSKIPMVAYRKGNTDSKVEGDDYRPRGEQIGIWPGPAPKAEEIDRMGPDEAAQLRKKVYFDLSALYINVTLQSSNLADEQSRLNVSINAVDRLGMSKEQAWERMGWKNFSLVQNQRATETLFEAELQNKVALKQLEVQQAQMQMQMEAQAQAAQQQQQAAMQQQASQQTQMNQMNAGSQMQAMQGMDMRQGSGMSAAQVAPNETRENVNGEAGIPL